MLCSTPLWEKGVQADALHYLVFVAELLRGLWEMANKKRKPGICTPLEVTGCLEERIKKAGRRLWTVHLL